MSVLDELTDDYERADALVNVLVDRATGTHPAEQDFRELRHYFVNHPELSVLLPNWFPSKMSVNQFWSFIKNRFSKYEERRQFLWGEFAPLLSHLEAASKLPADEHIEHSLRTFSSGEVIRAWQRTIQRVGDDPEGAITAARNLLETVLKHILDEREIVYDHDSIDLPNLFKKVQTELRLAPEQHHEQIFKQILGGCSSVVNGLGAMRNKLGDAHGKGSRRIRPSSRHAQLAVNLAGSMALFLTETHRSTARQ